MGKPNPILKILVHPDLWDLPCVVAWREAGHDVSPFSGEWYVQADILLGPNAHYFHPALNPHGEEVLKWARKRRKLGVSPKKVV